MSEHEAITLNNVILDFPVSRTGPAFLKEILTRRTKRNAPNFYRAVDGLSLEIRKGEVFGIIGPNGAGKSTLLRMMAGIYAPDEGSLRVEGRVSLLAGLGAGFQRNLTGRENISLSGSIYGISPDELYQMVPSIVVFSGIGKFIDQPLRTYSSGMRARLAFSIASHLSPDVLLIDEVLAVGDSSFREKSKRRIMEMVKGDATVVIVSHNAAILREICDRVMCIADGKVDVVSNDINMVIERYRTLSAEK
ncbi:ABC transporter ATP-binding protein [Candidatus Poseidoniales archaeon]|jgi:ABC-type polysaccharide/polyol phosphate transport system ATPase subunit|nr:ABC transporter ATP-binding protein [Candidatus Poseidoniales archaeon]